MAGADWTPEQYAKAREYLAGGKLSPGKAEQVSGLVAQYEAANSVPLDQSLSEMGPPAPPEPQPNPTRPHALRLKEPRGPSQLEVVAASMGDELPFKRQQDSYKEQYQELANAAEASKDDGRRSKIDGTAGRDWETFNFPGPQALRPDMTPPAQESGKYGKSSIELPPPDPNYDEELPTLSKMRHLFAPPMYLGDGGLPRVAFEPPLEHVQRVFKESQALQARFGGIPESVEDEGYKQYADAAWNETFKEYREKKSPLVRYSQIDFLLKDNPEMATLMKVGTHLLTGGASIILGVERGLTGGFLQESLAGASDNPNELAELRNLRESPAGFAGEVAALLSPSSVVSRATGGMARASAPGILGAMKAGAVGGAAHGLSTGAAELTGDAFAGKLDDVPGRAGEVIDRAATEAMIGGIASAPLEVLGQAAGAGAAGRRSSLVHGGTERALAREGGVKMNLLNRRGVRYPKRVEEIGRQIDQSKRKISLVDETSGRAATSTLNTSAQKINSEIDDIASQKRAYYQSNPSQEEPIDEAVDYVLERMRGHIAEGGEAPLVDDAALKKFYQKSLRTSIVPEHQVPAARAASGKATSYTPEEAVQLGLATRSEIEAAAPAGAGIDSMRVVVDRVKVNAKLLDEMLDIADDAAGVAGKSGARSNRQQFYRALGAELRKTRDRFAPTSAAPRELTRTVKIGGEDTEVSGWSALNETFRERLRGVNARKSRLGLSSSESMARIDVNDPLVFDTVKKRVATYMDEGAVVNDELVMLANANPELRKELKDLLAAKFGGQLRGREVQGHITGIGPGSGSPRVYLSSRLDEAANRAEAIGETLGGRVTGRSPKFRDLSKPLRQILNALKAREGREYLAHYLAENASRGLKHVKDKNVLQMLGDAYGVAGKAGGKLIEPLSPVNLRSALEDSLNYGLPLRGGAGGRAEAIRQEFAEDRTLTETDRKLLREYDAYYKGIAEVASE